VAQSGSAPVGRSGQLFTTAVAQSAHERTMSVKSVRNRPTTTI
jgi:hypothetical protein